MLTELAIAPVQDQFSLSQGIIRFKGKIWMGHSTKLQQQIIHALHASPIGGHSGALVTYIRIKQSFAWPRMKSDVQEFVAACQICQQAKTERVPYPGLL